MTSDHVVFVRDFSLDRLPGGVGMAAWVLPLTPSAAAGPWLTVVRALTW